MREVLAEAPEVEALAFTFVELDFRYFENQNRFLQLANSVPDAFRCLGRLSLYSLAIDGRELRVYLLRHAQTLRSLRFDNIIL